MLNVFQRLTHRAGALLLVFCLLVGLLPISADAAPVEAQSTDDEMVVRVGYNDLPGFLYTDESGNYRGYAYELLQQVSAYNNWTFQYIPVGYEDIQAAFENNRIDIFLPHQKTAARMELYEYSDNVFCTNHAALITSPDTSYYYDDYSSFANMRVGVEVSTRNGERFQQKFDEAGVPVQMMQIYNNNAEMEAALDNGEIDAFICASNRGISGYRIIDQLESTDSYVLAPKGNRTFLDPLDDALSRIDVDIPLFKAQLEEKYRMSSEGSYPSLTREEADFIAECEAVPVVVGRQDVDESGHFAGSIGEVLGLISERTGLEFKAVTGATTPEMFSLLESRQADVVFTFDADYHWAELHNVSMTPSYAAFTASMVKRSDTEELDEIAVVEGSYLAWYAENYLDYNLVYYPTNRECLDQVLNNKADAVLMNASFANYYATFPQYSRLVFNTRFDITNSYAIAVSKQANPLLLSILCKSIASIPESMLDSSFEAQTSSRQSAVTDIFYQNPLLAFGTLAALIVLLVTTVLVLVYVRVMRRKNLQLIAAGQAKDRFLGRMSHELRTPINAITGFAELSKQALDSDAPTPAKVEKLRVYAEDTSSSAHYLLSIVNDILDMTKIENNRIELEKEPIDATRYIDGIASMLQPLAQEKGITFKFERLTNTNNYFLADGVRIQQILMNLANNAIKFTPAGGSVTITVEVTSENDGISTVRFRVIDTGVGMSPEFQKTMFSPFTQEKNSVTSTTAGTGLGLAISKRLANLMDGDITCESSLDKGTTFTVVVKAQALTREEYEQRKDVTHEQAKESGYDFSGMQVLLVEDNAMNRIIAQQLLENKHATVTPANNGVEAIESFRNSEEGFFDLILMDIRMPIMDGCTAAERIRLLDRADAHTVPIVAMSANAFADDVQRSLDAGMNAHLAKPVDVDKLYAEVQEVRK